MFAIVVMACVSRVLFLIQDFFTNYFFYDGLVTSFKRVVKDKELLLTAHSLNIPAVHVIRRALCYCKHSACRGWSMP